jgi:hypothetical protein
VLWCTKHDGETAKQTGDHGGAHLGQQTTRQTSVAARGDGVAPLDSGDGGGSMWGSFGYKKTWEACKGVLVLLPASIAASSGGRRRAMMAARVRWVLSFADKNPPHGGRYF